MYATSDSKKKRRKYTCLLICATRYIRWIKQKLMKLHNGVEKIWDCDRIEGKSCRKYIYLLCIVLTLRLS